MPADFSIEINQADLRSINDMLSNMQDKVSDLTPLMKELAGIAEYAVEQNFRTEGSRLSFPWKKSQRAINQGGKTLQDTGRLAASITSKVTKDYATTGTNLVYAAIHNFGGKTGRGLRVTMPERPFMYLNKEDEGDVVDALDKFAASLLK